MTAYKVRDLFAPPQLSNLKEIYQNTCETNYSGETRANQFFNLECQPARGRFRYPLQQTARPKVGLVSGQLR